MKQLRRIERGTVFKLKSDMPMTLLELSTVDMGMSLFPWAKWSLFKQRNRFLSKWLCLNRMPFLKDSFTYAASYDIKAKYEHKVPKYALVYGTRHPDGVELMNDGMCKARLEFLGQQFSQGRLFDCTPEDEVPDLGELCEEVFGIIKQQGPMTRKAVKNRVIWKHFGKYESKTIGKAVGTLLKSGRLFSNTSKTRINDDVIVGCEPIAGKPCPYDESGC